MNDKEGAPEGAKVPAISRRSLCAGVGAAVVLLGCGGLKYAPSTPCVRPPGAQDEERFLSACIRCGKCLEVCPHDIIRPSHIEYGIAGMRTPVLDYSGGWCDWCAEANGGVPLCEETCPTEAIRLPEGATMESTVLGKAVINTDTCLAYRLTGCRFCYDACELDAIELDSDDRPVVVEDRCNGCGACESVCVSLQNASVSQGTQKRAITVEPLAAAGGGR